MIRAVVFDFDGVIAESAAVKTRAFRELFAGSGAVEEIVALHEREAGRSRFWKFSTIYRDILKKPLSEPESQALGRQFQALVYQAVLDSPLVDGCAEFLRDNAGRRALFIASGTPQDELRSIVQARGLHHYFLGVYGSPRGKAEIVVGILNQHGYAPHEVLFVGDARTDQEGAREAGVFFLGRTAPGDRAPWAAARCLPDLRTLEAEVARFDRAAPVSVAVCTLNGCSRGYIFEALDSVMAQTVYPEELLVVDDGSTDGTAEILESRYPGLRILKQPNRGLAEARNVAIRSTTSAYLAFLDDDDRWEPDKLARQLEQGAPATFTALQLIDLDGKPRGLRSVPPCLGWPEILLGNLVTGPSSALLARSVVEAVGFFRAGLGGAEDYDYWIRCARRTSWTGVDLPLVGYRVHAAQMSAGYGAMAEQALEIIDGHAQAGGERFRCLVLFYNALGVLVMGLGRRQGDAARIAWNWLRRLPWQPLVLVVRLLGMGLSAWPSLQRPWRRWEIAWLGRRLRELEQSVS